MNVKLVALVVVGAVLGGPVFGQAVPTAPAPIAKRPGAVHGGKLIGFVPRHERLQAERGAVRPQQPVSPSTYYSKTDSQTAVASDQAGAVQAANYTVPMQDPAFGGSLGGDIVLDSSCACGNLGCSGSGGAHGYGLRSMIWGSAEYLYWTTNGVDTPALATTGLDGTLQDDAGVLGIAGTSTLFGGNELHEDERSGGRYSLGMWLTPDQRTGLEVTYLSLGDDSESFSTSIGTFPILARPFFNTDLDRQDSRLIEFPALVEGSLSIQSDTEFDAFEINFRKAGIRERGRTGDLLLGYRRASLDESLRIDEQTESLADANLGATFELFDQFLTENEFHGGQIGWSYQGQISDCWSLGFQAKVALGNTRSRVAIDGQTTVTDADANTSTNSGGLLTQDSNIGTFRDNSFSTISELGIWIRRDLPFGVKAKLGYNYFLWTDVAQAGGQIDSRVNPTQIPPSTLTGEARPRSSFDRSDFSAHGLSAGLEYQF